MKTGASRYDALDFNLRRIGVKISPMGYSSSYRFDQGLLWRNEADRQSAEGPCRRSGTLNVCERKWVVRPGGHGATRAGRLFY